MQRIFFALVCALSPLVTGLFTTPQADALPVTITTVPVGNPGNAADTAVMSDGSTGYGSVGYSYSIGKYDVTVGQYAAFLNAVGASDSYGLYDSRMSTDLNVAGIARSGPSGSYTYSVIGSANHPITYVHLYDAMRFVNWLNNGQPTGAQDASTTETGAYTLNGLNPNPIARNSNVAWVLPNEDEWYKAAYYNPATSSYYKYGTSSDTLPTTGPPGSAPNTANYYSPSSGFAVTGSTLKNPNQNYLTDVGVYTASASPYGAFDMSGNVFQWNEIPSGGRIRGGSWFNDAFPTLAISSSGRYSADTQTSFIGFRVALVPEPSTLALLTLGGVIAFAGRRRRARN